MSAIGSRFTHRVTIVRQGGDGSLDDYGQPIVSGTEIATVRAAIQPKSAREQALISQAGAAVSDHTIYMFPTDLTTADAIVHDASDCPVANDLPDARYQIDAVPNAAGLGHHLEVAATLVAYAQQAEGS